MGSPQRQPGGRARDVIWLRERIVRDPSDATAAARTDRSWRFTGVFRRNCGTSAPLLRLRNVPLCLRTCARGFKTRAKTSECPELRAPRLVKEPGIWVLPERRRRRHHRQQTNIRPLTKDGRFRAKPWQEISILAEVLPRRRAGIEAPTRTSADCVEPHSDNSHRRAQARHQQTTVENMNSFGTVHGEGVRVCRLP